MRDNGFGGSPTEFDYGRSSDYKQLEASQKAGLYDRINELEKNQMELLAALEDAVSHVNNQGDVGVDYWMVCERKCIAAIEKALNYLRKYGIPNIK